MAKKLRWARAFGYGLIAAALLETLAMNLFTLVQIARARTSVPYWDEWALVQDLAQIDLGHAVWPILWSSYWGERQVVTRVLWMANAHLRSLASLTWLTLLFQFVHIGVLIALAWLLLGRTAQPEDRARSGVMPFLVACVVILNLLMSPFQMMNFVWSTQIMFIFSFLVATGCFLCLALADGKYSTLFVALAAVLALLGSLTMPNNLLAWPVLVLQAIYLKRSRRVIAMLALIGAVAIGFYLWRYTRPDMGMGVVGMLRRPLQAILLLGVVVAGPAAFISNAVAAACGVLTLGVTGYLSVRALRLDARERPWLSALVGTILFLVLSSASVVAGRLDRRFLGRDPLYSVPVRYPTMFCVLWACIALLALYTCWHRQIRYAPLGFYAVPFFYFMFATAHLQFGMAQGWADAFRTADALGAAFLLDVHDEQVLSRVWTNRTEREERVAFLRKKGLAMFHEPRAAWMGRNVSELFSLADSARCVGMIEKTTRLDGFARVQGWAWDLRSGTSLDYVLLTDAAGRIIGQGRGGLTHGQFAGLSIEPEAVPASHAGFRYSEWLGYVRQDADSSTDQIRLLGVFASQGKVCAIRPERAFTER
jgi:hypothetical protein